MQGEYGGCSSISHRQQRRRYWNIRHTHSLMCLCDYGLFTKMKEPLRGTLQHREEIIHVVTAGHQQKGMLLVVYDALHKFGRRWCTWGGGGRLY
jgi:hypothetical protein